MFVCLDLPKLASCSHSQLQLHARHSSKRTAALSSRPAVPGLPATPKQQQQLACVLTTATLVHNQTQSGYHEWRGCQRHAGTRVADDAADHSSTRQPNRRRQGHTAVPMHACCSIHTKRVLLRRNAWRAKYAPSSKNCRDGRCCSPHPHQTYKHAINQARHMLQHAASCCRAAAAPQAASRLSR